LTRMLVLIRLRRGLSKEVDRGPLIPAVLATIVMLDVVVSFGFWIEYANGRKTAIQHEQCTDRSSSHVRHIGLLVWPRRLINRGSVVVASGEARAKVSIESVN
jgi:hypothetical protein